MAKSWMTVHRFFLRVILWISIRQFSNGFSTPSAVLPLLPPSRLSKASLTIIHSASRNEHPSRSELHALPIHAPSNSTVFSQILVKSNPEVSFHRSDKSEVASKPPRRPLVRLMDNLWYVMCTPFPDLRKLSRKRDLDSKHVVSIRLRDGFAAVFAYLMLGVISYRYIFEKWSFVDALYFSCVTFSTVGYGDLYPQTVAGKFFCCLFGISGIALLGAAVARIGSRLVEAEITAIENARKQSQRQLLQIYDKMPKAVMALRRSSHKNHNKMIHEARELLASIPHPHFPSFLTTFWNAARYIIQSLCIVAVGGLVIGHIEGWKWYDSLYYGLMTASTIGLGDFAPTTKAGRLAAVVFIPMGVAAAGEIMASVGLAVVMRRQKSVFRSQLNKGLSMETLNDMDVNHDGKVMREEYVYYMLMEMGLVTKEELEELCDQFERLDGTKSGYLDYDDLLLMAKLRGAGLVES